MKLKVMKAPDKIIWGIVGAGDVCEVKSAPAMMQLPHSTIKTVMRRNAHKAADYAFRHHIPQWTTDLDELLADNEINAIYVATPPSSHATIVKKAAAAKKAVYVEKPMATSYAECCEMIDDCRRAGVALYVAYYRRTLPGFLKVKDLIDKKSVGNVRFVKIEMNQPLVAGIVAQTAENWRVQPEISGGGYFHDLASHQLDFLDFIFGEITEATGFSLNQAGYYPADDVVSGVFRFADGITGIGNWCFSTGLVSEKEIIQIVGSEGEITFNSFGNPMIVRLTTANGCMEEFVFNHQQPIQQSLIKLVVEALRGEIDFASNAVSAARANRVMELMTKAKR